MKESSVETYSWNRAPTWSDNPIPCHQLEILLSPPSYRPQNGSKCTTNSVVSELFKLLSCFPQSQNNVLLFCLAFFNFNKMGKSRNFFSPVFAWIISTQPHSFSGGWGMDHQILHFPGKKTFFRVKSETIYVTQKETRHSPAFIPQYNCNCFNLDS